MYLEQYMKHGKTLKYLVFKGGKIMVESTDIESPYDSILQEDLEYIANNCLLLKELDNKVILITGATGLIGSQIVKTLLCYNRLNKTNIYILALVRSKEKAQTIFGRLLNNKNLELIKGDILRPLDIHGNIDYIIHGASPTNSKDFVISPVETINAVLDGTKNILELGKQKNIKGIVYLSSYEVYGITDPLLESVDENAYGYINILDVRSSYSEGKRMAECICSSYAKQYNMPVKIARLTQTFGPGVEYTDNRVFAQFARSVIEKRDIVLRTTGDTTRTYCYIRCDNCSIFCFNEGEKR